MFPIFLFTISLFLFNVGNVSEDAAAVADSLNTSRIKRMIPLDIFPRIEQTDVLRRPDRICRVLLKNIVNSVLCTAGQTIYLLKTTQSAK